MTRRETKAAILALAAFAGCGGPSERERLTRWQSQTDATCRQVEARVTDRGRPVNVADLDRVTVRAVDDVRAAMREVARRPVPAGSEARVRPFVDAVRRLEPRVDELVSAGEFLDETRLLVAVDKVQKPAKELERLARRAGLSDCARDGFADRVSDALLTPLFVQRFNKIQAGLYRDFAAFRKDRRVAADHTVTFFDVFDHLTGMVTVIDDTQDAFGGLYPPTVAVDLLTKQSVVLTRESTLLSRAAERVSHLHVVSLRRLDRRLDALERRRIVLVRKIAKALGTPTPRSGPAAGEES